MNILPNQSVYDQFKHVPSWDWNVVPTLSSERRWQWMPFDVVMYLVSAFVYVHFILELSCTCVTLHRNARLLWRIRIRRTTTTLITSCFGYSLPAAWHFQWISSIDYGRRPTSCRHKLLSFHWIARNTLSLQMQEIAFDLSLAFDSKCGCIDIAIWTDIAFIIQFRRAFTFWKRTHFDRTPLQIVFSFLLFARNNFLFTQLINLNWLWLWQLLHWWI